MIMRDAEIKEQQDRWMALSSKWLPSLWLDHWHITYHWFAEPLDGRPPGSRHGLTSTVCEVTDGIPARVYVQPPYMTADVEVDLRLILGMPDHELEKLFLHEMAHLLLAHMERVRASAVATRDANEYLATWLARIWMGLDSDSDEKVDAGTVDQRDYTTEGPDTARKLGETGTGHAITG